jgi:hypothetical protein
MSLIYTEKLSEVKWIELKLRDGHYCTFSELNLKFTNVAIFVIYTSVSLIERLKKRLAKEF